MGNGCLARFVKTYLYLNLYCDQHLQLFRPNITTWLATFNYRVELLCNNLPIYCVLINLTLLGLQFFVQGCSGIKIFSRQNRKYFNTLF